MTAEEKWRELRYGSRIDEIKKILIHPALGRPYKSRTITPDELTFDDVLRLSIQEGLYNWFNYWPISSTTGTARTPEQCILDVIRGKCLELLSALQFKDRLTEYPTVFQPEPRSEYDYKLNGIMHDCKSSKSEAVNYIIKHRFDSYRHIAVYPETESGGKQVFKTIELNDEMKLELYITGELNLSVDELRQIRLSLDVDVGCRPESKYWAAHGYASREEWYEVNGESLEEYDRSIDARRALFAEIEKKLGLKIEPAEYPA